MGVNKDITLLNKNVMINVFEMLINRIDNMNDNINKINTYLVNEARFKTNNIIDGCIFNHPFEIQNYNFDKKNYAFITIKLNDKLNHRTLYDIIWSILLNEEITDYREAKIQNSMIDFIKNSFGIDLYNKIVDGIKLYIDEENEDYLTCKKYDIDTTYEYLPEFIINEFVIKNDQNQYFKSFNHVSYGINISFINQNKSIYIDELIDLILLSLKQYGYNALDINNIKIVGLDYFMYNLISFYDINELNHDLIKPKVIDYIKQLCQCVKDKLRKTIMDHSRECKILPIFKNIEIIEFLMDILEPDDF
jgi:hypothetical protein